MAKEVINQQRNTGEIAREQNIQAVKTLYDILKGTLGPKGTDKLLLDSAGNIIVTNDGVTIMQELNIEHPVARMMVDIAKTQEDEVADGTTTVILYSGRLLENAKILMDKGIHPTTILDGYKIAKEKALEILKEISKEAEETDYKNLVKTTITGKGAETIKEKLSEIIVEAIKKYGYENIKIIKINGEQDNSDLIDGLVINEQIFNEKTLNDLENPKVLLLDFDLDNKDTDRDTQLTIDSAEKLNAFLEVERNYLYEIVEKIKKSGAKAVFCQKGVNDLVINELANEGILVIRRLNKFDMEKLEQVTNTKRLTSLEQIEPENTGKANRIKIKRGKEEFYIFVENQESKVGTICLYGATKQSLDEVRRAVTDGLGVINSLKENPYILAGGGAVEIEISNQLKKYAKNFSGREQLAIEKFAESFECIPEILAENAGLDKIDILAKLKNKHKADKTIGLNITKNKIENTIKAGIIEPYKVKSQAINSSFEITNAVLRISDLLVAKNKE